MKGYNVEPEMTKATIGIGKPPSDIRWHKDVDLPVAGWYIAQITLDYGFGIYPIYWDGEKSYVTTDVPDETFPLSNIHKWALDKGDE